MQIRSQCPRCGNIQHLHEHAADRRIRCVHCKYLYSVPSLENLPKATRIIKGSKSHLYVDKDGNTFA